jgi:hypothetical protein
MKNVGQNLETNSSPNKKELDELLKTTDIYLSNNNMKLKDWDQKIKNKPSK